MAPKGSDLLKGRKLINGQRYVGCINEWHSTWGWIEPLDVVNHPHSKRNKGRIYVNKTDCRGYVKMAVGEHLDFKIYHDARGLGAVDCTSVQKGAIQAAAAVTAEAEEEILPEGWEKHWSAEQEEYFYWNRLTKQTSWLPPAPAQAQNEEDELPLPPGWDKHYDEENHEWYYWNKKTKKASWERPEMPSEESNEPPTKKAKNAAETPGEDAPIGMQRFKGRIAEWHGIFGWIVPSQALSPELTPLLQKGEGKIYVNWRDVQPGVEAKVNMEVEFMLHEDDTGLAATDVGPPSDGKKTASKIAGVANKLASKWAEEDAAMDDAEEENEADANDGPLMPGWDQHWSDEHNCYYYWHKATKVASWERPTMPAGDDDEDEEEGPNKVWEGEGSEGGAAFSATPQTPFVSMTGREMTPTTPVSSQKKIPTNHTVASKAITKKEIGGSSIKAAIPAWKSNQQWKGY